MSTLVTRFVTTFQRAVQAEMRAMQERLGSFEVLLSQGRLLEAPQGREPGRWSFAFSGGNEKLQIGAECSLSIEGGEWLVTVEAIDEGRLDLRCERDLPPKLDEARLVIYPWFLYERLRSVLGSVGENEALHVKRAMTLFGKGRPRIQEELPGEGSELNASQRKAVALALGSELAFVWGPPGTGKTRTLARIVAEFVKKGKRVLVTSTTNAAVDGALAALAETASMGEDLAAGRIVRIGQSEGPSFSASLREVSERRGARVRLRMNELERREPEVHRGARRCGELADRIEAVGNAVQLELFRTVPAAAVSEWELAELFGPDRARSMKALPPRELVAGLRRRKKRLERLLPLLADRCRAMRSHLRALARGVILQAHVLLTTMTGLYMNPLLEGMDWDVLVVDEAGMATLPTLFYAACLARDATIMVGDPRQLPPIVQARDAFVQKAMGRSIFEVTVPEAGASAAVVLLETQYRMHPSIGELVSRVFYDGRLHHGVEASERDAITGRRPFPGAPLILVDDEGTSRCERAAGGSRGNAATAEAAVALVAEALADGLRSVAIVTPYVEQTRRIRRLLRHLDLGEAEVDCATVHRFQGHERDLVIVDLVDAEPLEPGCLLASGAADSSSAKLLNVAVSRARGKLVLLASRDYFRRHRPDAAVTRLLLEAEERGMRVALSRCPSRSFGDPSLP